ncbi:tannase/feruloyl esterase family alpha/beta hydrolase [Scytonema sp. PCC 10023]|uniref:tannase/feruloyl esterase family alpha/beta hydrolase n=1 Tax=Scytonema sp. PCC 10023 TaxID=1680591 RepID=UPI0039C71E97
MSKQSGGFVVRCRRLQSLFQDGSIILRFLLIALVFSVLLDWLTPIVAWVEQGTPPTKIIAFQTADDSASGGFSNPTERATSSNATIVRTRPIFPYPMQATYSGKGSIDDAVNFVGVMLSRIPNDRIDWIGNDLFQPQ